MAIGFVVGWLEGFIRGRVEAIREENPEAKSAEVISTVSGLVLDFLGSGAVGGYIEDLVGGLTSKVVAEYFKPDKDTWAWG